MASPPPVSGVGAWAWHTSLAQNWWLILLRGIFAVLFGVLTFAWPGITLLTLVTLFGAYALIDGVFSVAAAIRGDGAGARWWLAIVGVAGIVAGAGTFVFPGMTAFLLLTFISVWMIVIGGMEIAGAIALRKVIDNEWMLVAGGLLSLLAGIALLAWPGPGALGLLFAIGGYAILYGIVLIALAFRLKKHR
jgi:uncharacterized membrane protein HdeD (DUF308 family)